MTTRPPEDPLKALAEKIDSAKEARRPKPAPKSGKFAGAGFGWRMTVDLVTGVLVGAAMGWGLDTLFGSKPLFLIVMVLLGFAAGVRVMLKTAEEFNKENASPDHGDASEEDEHGDRS